MLEYKFKAFHKQTKKIYPVINLCTQGTIKEHELLDIYSDDADDGTAPTIKVHEALLIIMRASSIIDQNNEEIYADSIIKYDNNETMSHWVRDETALIVDYGYKMVARMKPFNKEMTGNQNILDEEFSDCVTVIGNRHQEPELLEKIDKLYI